MAEENINEENDEIVLQDNFYKDSFHKFIIIGISLVVGIGLMIALAIYNYLDKPQPIAFKVFEERRVQPAVPMDQPYLSTPDLLQWVGEVVPKSFIYDFNNYNNQLKTISQYFTAEGWKIFLNQLNIYANYNNVQNNKLFVNGTLTAVPQIFKQGLLSGRYAWWVEMPVSIKYDGFKPPPEKNLKLQILVVRVPTLNNLMGVGIENVIVANSVVSVPVENG